MEFKHVLVCVQQRPPGHPMGSCSDRQSREVMQRFLERQQMDPELIMRAMITPTGCLNACGAGPVVVVYPDGVWYGGVRPEDVDEIMDKHIKNGEIVERLVVSRGKPPGMF